MPIKSFNKCLNMANMLHKWAINHCCSSHLLIVFQIPTSTFQSEMNYRLIIDSLTPPFCTVLQASLFLLVDAGQPTTAQTPFQEGDVKIQKQKKGKGKLLAEVNTQATVNLLQQKFHRYSNGNLLALSRILEIHRDIKLQPQLSTPSLIPFIFPTHLAERRWCTTAKSSYFNIMLNFMIYNQKNIKMASNIFRQTLSRFKHHQAIADIAMDCKKDLNISVCRGLPFKIADVLWKFELLEKKYNSSICEGSVSEWKEDQKKVLLCFLVAYSQLLCKKISEINDQEWEHISRAFHNKDVLLLKYEAKSIERNSQRVHWQVQEQKMLASYLSSQLYGRWAQISRKLFFDSRGDFFKTPKQCRQHWFNHMNISIKRGEWLVEQDLAILESVLDHGRKWARIVDLLHGRRTEHMIKNRYHSLLALASTKKQCKNQGKIVKLLLNQLSANNNQTRNSRNKLSLRLHLDQKLQQNQPQYSSPAQVKQKDSKRGAIAQQGQAQPSATLLNLHGGVKVEEQEEMRNQEVESYLGQANSGVFTPYAANSATQSFSMPFFYGLNPSAFMQGQMLAVPIYLPINSNMFSY